MTTRAAKCADRRDLAGLSGEERRAFLEAFDREGAGHYTHNNFLPEGVYGKARGAGLAAVRALAPPPAPAPGPPINEVRYGSTTSQMAGAPGPEPFALRRLAAGDDDEDDDERDQVVVLRVFGEDDDENMKKTKTRTFGEGPMAITFEAPDFAPDAGPTEIMIGERPSARETLVRSCSVPPELARQLPDETLLRVLPAFAMAKKAGIR